MAKFSDLSPLSIGNTIQLVGAIWSGENHTYLCMFPGEEGEIHATGGEDISFKNGEWWSKVEILNMTTQEWEQFIQQTDKLDIEALVETPEGQVIKAIIRKSQRQIAQNVSWAVFKRDGYRCCYCGRDDVPLTVDHLVLWEEGGPSIEENLLSACRKCNKTRGNTPYAKWLNHPYYKQVSRNLTEKQSSLNQLKALSLSSIPITPQQPSKRK